MFRLDFNNVSFQIKKKIVFLFFFRTIICYEIHDRGKRYFYSFYPETQLQPYTYVCIAFVTGGNERSAETIVFNIWTVTISRVIFIESLLLFFRSSPNLTAFVSFTNTFGNDDLDFR